MAGPADVLQFQLEPEPEQPKAPPPQPAHNAALAMLLVALKTLSQRTIVALANLRKWVLMLLTTGSVFWLWLSIPDPNTYQLVGMGMYAFFVIVINSIAVRSS